MFRKWMIPCLALVMSASAHAQTITKEIGVVNTSKIMSESRAAKSAGGQLEAKQKEFQTELNRQQTALQKENQDLGNQRAVLSPEAFAQKAKALQQKANDAQKQLNQRRMTLGRAERAALQAIQVKVLEIVRSVAAERGLKMVVKSSQTLYFDASLDVTQEVLDRLNKQMPSYQVKF